jgi:uncharacterized protein (TIGR02996 family)
MTPYSHPRYAAFIDAIRARPDDDLPRLMCADWLREQGEEDRAEFIQVQCRIAELEREVSGKMPPPPSKQDRDEWRELKRRERKLHLPNYSAHLKTLPLISHPTGYPNRIGIYSGDGYVEFVRGFVDSLRIRGADWITHADAILRINPVRKVTLVGGPPIVEKFRKHRPVGNDGLWECEKWPGIAFAFERESDYTHPTEAGYNHINGVILDRIAQSLAVPSHLIDHDLMQAIDDARGN